MSAHIFVSGNAFQMIATRLSSKNNSCRFIRIRFIAEGTTPCYGIPNFR
jgi:hypothetical protein